jgi:signal transduction histidine kinase
VVVNVVVPFYRCVRSSGLTLGTLPAPPSTDFKSVPGAPGRARNGTYAHRARFTRQPATKFSRPDASLSDGLLLPDRPKEARQVLETAIHQAAQAITESRDTVQSLRGLTSGKNDLIESLTALGGELGASYSNPETADSFPEFRLLVEGAPEPLHPVLQDEVYRIVRESVGNAFRHAHATRIEVDLRFERRLIRLRVRDDGIGMDSDLARDGRGGHWGIPGMRERAKNIGGRFEMWSEPGAGTEIEITIPAAVAYRRESSLENDSGYTARRL